ncbi:zinc finger protein 729-like [Pararge aegeria]|uniref:zinc finger protein 729-like n=1 Tax=Pararge aegeria TaxID=116150 RepID=UPI0019D01E90|nr:zinc finger protein 729-like [Pararge aegeria]
MEGRGIKKEETEAKRAKRSSPNKVKQEEMRKHGDNIYTMFTYTNATPIRCKNDFGYACCFCTDVYQEPSQLKEHTIECHGTEMKTRFMDGKRLGDYLVKLDITKLRCSICVAELKTLDEALTHLKEHDKPMHLDINNHLMPFNFEGGDLTCAYCNVMFNKFKKLLEHMNRHYRNCVCDICGAGFINRSTFTVHYHGHSKGYFPCQQCQKVFDTKRKQRSHEMAIHVHAHKTYRCGYCNEHFSTHWRKEKHIASEHGVNLREIKCQVCDKVCLTANSLRIHMKRDHLKERRFECKVCEYRFFGAQELREHTVKHTGIRDYKCDICLKSYGKKSTLREHIRIHADDRRFKCEHCRGEVKVKLPAKDTNSFKAIKEERNKHLDNITTILQNTNATPIRCERDSRYGCCFCAEFYREPAELKKHNITKHQRVSDTIMRGKKLSDYIVKLDITGLKCNLCTLHVTDLTEMMEHLKSHKKTIHVDIDNHIVPFIFENDELKCAICKIDFNTFRRVFLHMHSHYRNHVCDVCAAGFINEKSFVVHYRIHKKGVFPCAFCKKEFDTYSRKKTHESGVHTNSLRCKCSYCGERFTNSSKKMKHISSVHNVRVRDVKCKICGKGCSSMESLRVHTKRDHLMERKYECQYCNNKYFRLNELKNHLITHTGNKQYPYNQRQKRNNEKSKQTSKHLDNVTTILKHTNATPIGTHDESIGYGCYFCENFYGNPKELKKHTKFLHSADFDNVMDGKTLSDYVVNLDITGLRCNLCNLKVLYSTPSLEDMMRHLRDHNKDVHMDIENHLMPFNFKGNVLKCVITNCQQEFREFHKLAEHMHFHYRNYVCEKCAIGFINETSYREHLVSHSKRDYNREDSEINIHTADIKTAVEVYSRTLKNCDYCEKQFKLQRNKEQHMASVHGRRFRKINCQICYKSCSSLEALRKHTRKDHMKRKAWYTG